MKIVLDANISWRLVSVLQPYCEKIWHVDSLDVSQPLKDYEIWEFARQHEAIVITNDDDFYKLSIIKGFPPKVVVLRTGNQSRNYIADILIKHIPDIQSLESSEYGLLEIIG